MNFGEYKICCDSQSMGQVQNENFDSVWNGELWRSVRRSVIADKRHPACESCWKKEDLAFSSPRESHTRYHQLLNDCSASGHLSTLPKIVSLRLGNLCNLKCVMCAPFNSTKWNEDGEIYATHVDQVQTFVAPPDILDEQWPLDALRTVEHLTLIGGEPLLIKSHLKILDYLISSGRAAEVTLKYFSNTTFLPAWCQEYWSQFKRIEFRSSIDGTDETYNYIRYPGRWTDVIKAVTDLNALKLKDLDYGICYVFMSLNAANLESLFAWRETFSWQINSPIIRPDYLTEPYFFQAHTLPDSEKEKAAHSLERILANYIQSPMEAVLIEEMKAKMLAPHTDREILQKNLRSYLTALDKRRSTVHQNIFPHLDGH